MQRTPSEGLCTVRATVCPEHKVRDKPYNTTVVIKEKEYVERAQCHDCVASAGEYINLFTFTWRIGMRLGEPAMTNSCFRLNEPHVLFA